MKESFSNRDQLPIPDRDVDAAIEDFGDRIAANDIDMSNYPPEVVERYEKVGKVVRDLSDCLPEAADKEDRWYESRNRVRIVRRVGEENIDTNKKRDGWITKTAEYTVDRERAESKTIIVECIYDLDETLRSIIIKFPPSVVNDSNRILRLVWITDNPYVVDGGVNELEGGTFELAEELIEDIKKSIE